MNVRGADGGEHDVAPARRPADGVRGALRERAEELEVALAALVLVEGHVRLDRDALSRVPDVRVAARDEREPVALGLPGKVRHGICARDGLERWLGATECAAPLSSTTSTGKSFSRTRKISRLQKMDFFVLV